MPQSRQSVTRRFLAASVLDDYYREVTASGPIAAIESPELRDAPVGTLVIRDDDGDGARGVVVAERRPDGWLVR